jgi:hypothetical protein
MQKHLEFVVDITKSEFSTIIFLELAPKPTAVNKMIVGKEKKYFFQWI